MGMRSRSMYRSAVTLPAIEVGQTWAVWSDAQMAKMLLHWFDDESSRTPGLEVFADILEAGRQNGHHPVAFRLLETWIYDKAIA